MDLIFYLKAAFIGVVEGLTEFLPVSSTGHMIIAERVIKLSENSEFTNSFEVIIQLGAILAVCVYFFKKLWPFVKDKNEKSQRFNMWIKVIAAFIPTAVIGALYSNYGMKEILFKPEVVAFTLVFYGIVIIWLEKINGKKNSFKINEISEISLKNAVIVGLFQCLAMVPGTSRSAATIIGAMLLGFSRTVAAEFSFFLAVPTMFAAAAKDIMDSGMSFTTTEWTAIAVGFIVSFVVALGVIKFFIKFIQSRDFALFGYYRVAAGAVIALLIFQGFF